MQKYIPVRPPSVCHKIVSDLKTDPDIFTKLYRNIKYIETICKTQGPSCSKRR